jgi:hypothetical protein
MAACEETSVVYPILADVFYPIVTDAGYGSTSKKWILDRTIACAFNPASRKYKQDVQPNPSITIDNQLVGRVKTDLTQSSRDGLFAITNIIIANIRDANGNIIYNESAGIRAGKSTIFEISTFNPIVGPFGKTDYFKVVLARSDNQAADI